jgi:hypothetical protein
MTGLNYKNRVLELSTSPAVKTILSIMLFCALLPTAFAQGGPFTDILRSVTGTVGRTETPTTTQTSVLGVRGMDEGDAKASAPAPSSEGVKMIEGWAVGRREAEAAAGRRGLTARAVNYDNAAADNAKPQGSQ